VTYPQFQQLADVGRGPEWVAQRLGVEIEGRCGDKLAIDLGEQERAIRERSAVEGGQALERKTVILSAVTDQDRVGQLDLERGRPAPSRECRG
jgi:hypothetical protein